MTTTSSSQRVGVIEIGSRAVRLLVADVRAGADLQIVGTDWKETALGKAVAAGGVPLEQKIDELTRLLAAFRQRAVSLSAGRLAVFGTEAVRRLSAVSLHRLKTSVPELQVLTGQEEAELSFIAGVMGTRAGPKTLQLVIDQGSGSMEVVVGKLSGRVAISEYQSLKLGTQELVAALHRMDGSLSRLREAVRKQVEALPALENATKSKPIVLGSAATKLAWLEARPDPMKGYDPRLVHGRLVRLAHIDALMRVAEVEPETARRVIDPRNPQSSEFETVMGGLVGLEAILRRERKDDFVVCAHGTRYGFAWKLALPPPAIKRARRKKPVAAP